MKLILKIALGVFLGSMASFFVSDAWRKHQDEMAKAETEKTLEQFENARAAQSEQIRAMLLQAGKVKPSDNNSPPGFIPDDSQTTRPLAP
jgi:uncharacterized protein YneF (UPF0154 family)